MMIYLTRLEYPWRVDGLQNYFIRSRSPRVFQLPKIYLPRNLRGESPRYSLKIRAK